MHIFTYIGNTSLLPATVLRLTPRMEPYIYVLKIKARLLSWRIVVNKTKLYSC